MKRDSTGSFSSRAGQRGQLIAPGLCLIASFFSGFSVRASAKTDSAPVSNGLANKGTVVVGAEYPAFQYSGRIDRHTPSAPVLSWQGSEVAVAFESSTFALRFKNAKGQNFFDLRVDGTSRVLEAKEGADGVIPFSETLAPGRHELVLFKRSEAAAGTVEFAGMELAPSGRLFTPPEKHYKLRLLFLGDSITVGACNEDGDVDQWENRRTHNSALSYAALTAKDLEANYQNISVSGMGIVRGYVPVKAKEIWNAFQPEKNSRKADLSTWVPDLVCVNLGENDASFTRGHGEPFPASFAEDYVRLIRDVRQAYPQCQILLLRGGMGEGHGNPAFKASWTAAVEELERNDERVHHFVFEHWSMLHPRVADDRAMAAELVLWLKAQAFFKSYE